MIPRSQALFLQASAHSIPLPAGFFHCSVTSPPYYRVRKYKDEQRVSWPAVEYAPLPGLAPITIPAMEEAAFGWEPTIEAYVGHVVLIYREVYRVLRDDGVAWLNLGDAHASGPQADHHGDPKAPRRLPENRCRTAELPSGNCLLLPYRVALALQADGWIVRSPNVWQQVACMPESIGGWYWQRHRVKVKSGAFSRQGDPGAGSGYERHGQDLRDREGPQWADCPGCPRCAPHGGYVLVRKSWRHTQAHEYVYQLVKDMQYFANQELVREPSSGNSHSRGRGTHPKSNNASRDTTKQNASFSTSVRHVVSTRNPRSVITPPPVRGFSGDHYAAFSPMLIAPLIRATCPTRSCPHCGAPWAPIVERQELEPQEDYAGKWASQAPQASGRRMQTNVRAGRSLGLPHDNPFPTPVVLGYRPTCACPEHEPVPGWCLDPFVGSGTTIEVGRELGVNVVGLDIAPAYLDRHCKPRVGVTPAGALEELPLFGAQLAESLTTQETPHD